MKPTYGYHRRRIIGRQNLGQQKDVVQPTSLSLAQHYMNNKTKNTFKENVAFNYCVSFIDLLGQRIALKDQNLLPPLESEDEWEKLHAVIRESMYAIFSLQSQAEEIIQGIKNPNTFPSFKDTLDQELQISWDEANYTEIKTHRWSDGLMSFACLNDSVMKCHMNGVHGLFLLTGLLCLQGLAKRQPIRGGIEIAWGIELQPNELYGPAVVRAYELESEIAQYPRIVVGPKTIELLDAHQADTKQDPHSQCNQELATICRNMLIEDTDGYWILHYLGKEFQNSFNTSQYANIYTAARKFAFEQLLEHKNKQDTKLAFRYLHLLKYFDEYPITAN